MRPLAFALMILTFLAAPASAQTLTEMTGQIDFDRYIADKRWIGENGDKGIFRKNGTWAATIGGRKGSGTWVWVDTFWCRGGTLGGQPLKSDCQVLHANDTHFSFTRNKGKGETTVYKFRKSVY